MTTIALRCKGAHNDVLTPTVLQQLCAAVALATTGREADTTFLFGMRIQPGIIDVDISCERPGVSDDHVVVNLAAKLESLLTKAGLAPIITIERVSSQASRVTPVLAAPAT